MTRHIVLAGGGTGGHIEPMLATGAALRALDPDVQITCLGSVGGLETTLVPSRGFDLAVVPAVPLPRKPSMDLLRLPVRLVRAVRQARAVLRRTEAQVVAGFGGYAALPAYLAARSLRIPVVVHEANAAHGLANKVGARWAKVVAAATPAAKITDDSVVVGMPIRASIATLDRAVSHDEALTELGLRPGFRTLLVYGGSQGARTLNTASIGAADRLLAAGIQVLHSYGRKNTVDAPRPADGPAYVAVPYIDRMDLAYAAADAVLCRCGMGTVAEVSAVGLPAMYVPLPHGNGEQRQNAQPVVDAGGGLLVDDADLTADYLIEHLLPLLQDTERLSAMGSAARVAGHRDAATVLAEKVLAVAGD